MEESVLDSSTFLFYIDVAMGLGVKASGYILGISLLAIITVSQGLQQYPLPWHDEVFLLAILLFATLTFLTEVYEVELTYKRTISTGIAVGVAAILLGGMPFALVITAIGVLAAEIFLRWGRIKQGLWSFALRVSFNTSQLLVATYAAAWVYHTLGGQPLLQSNIDFNNPAQLHAQILPALGAFATRALVNNALVSGIITLTQGTSFFYHLRFNLHHLLAEILSLGVLGVLMAFLYAWAPWNLALILIPLGLVHISLRNYMKLRHEAQKAFEQIVLTLSARDPYTYEHSKQVAEIAEKIARKLRLPEDMVEKVRSAAMIHDIGKIGIPDEILQKPGPLTKEEWAIMKKHPDIGADLIKGLEIYADIVDIIRYEHERWDGSGYPKGLKGEEIPLGARIVAAADIWNALTTDRPYRPAYSHEEAVRMIREMRGKELDPTVADALLSIVEEQRVEAQAQAQFDEGASFSPALPEDSRSQRAS